MPRKKKTEDVPVEAKEVKAPAVEPIKPKTLKKIGGVATVSEAPVTINGKQYIKVWLADGTTTILTLEEHLKLSN